MISSIFLPLGVGVKALHTYSMKCPCSSDLPYEQCCKPFHEGKAPSTALELMRSRYAAYALDLPDYIIKTTHPKCQAFMLDFTKWKKSIREFSRNTIFEKLTICDYDLQEEVSHVTFTAHLKQFGKDASFTEKSRFEK